MQSQETKTIMDETRRSIVDEILAMGDLKGDKEYHELAKLVCTSLGNISKVVENEAVTSVSVSDSAIVSSCLKLVLPTDSTVTFAVHPWQLTDT